MNKFFAAVIAGLAIGAYGVAFLNTQDLVKLNKEMSTEIATLNEQVFHLQEELEALRLNQDQYMLHMCAMDDQCDVLGLAEQMGNE